MISVVILCGGLSSRMEINVNKVLLPLEDKPVFMHSVCKFKSITDDIIVVANINDYEEILTYHDNVVIGGAIVILIELIINSIKRKKNKGDK